MIGTKNVTAIVTIDSSGFTHDSASTYYFARTGKTYHDHHKTTISVNSDLNLLVIVSCHSQVVVMTQRSPHYTPCILPHKKSKYYFMDNSYDSVQIPQTIHEVVESAVNNPHPGLKNASCVFGKFRQIINSSLMIKFIVAGIWLKPSFQSRKDGMLRLSTIDLSDSKVKEIKLKCIIFPLIVSGKIKGFSMFFEHFNRAEFS